MAKRRLTSDSNFEISDVAVALGDKDYIVHPNSDGSLTVRISDGSNTASVDEICHGLNVIDSAHHHYHEEEGYIITHSSLANNTDSIILRIGVSSGTLRPHMIFNIDSALASTVEFWIDSTSSHDITTEKTPINRWFGSSKTSICDICTNPSGVEVTPADIIQYIGAADTPGKVNVGGSTNTRGEFILEPGMAYLIQLTSRADNNSITISLDWYEE